jgi:hypothetical protein
MRRGKLDAETKVIRFGCGFIMGAVIWFALIGLSRFWFPVVGLGVMCGVLFGWLAVRHGERFWHKLGKWLEWIP